MARVISEQATLKGKLGGIVFQCRGTTNYGRSYSKPTAKQTEKQEEHRSQYGQVMRLGSLWNRDFIKPYYQGGTTNGSPFTEFIKYTWQHWDKQNPAWQTAIPFWNVERIILFGSVCYPGTKKDNTPLHIMANIPQTLSTPQSELYGFHVSRSPEYYHKIPAQPVGSGGIQCFKTDLETESDIPISHYVCWLQSATEKKALCMPVNQNASLSPSFPDWKTYTCAVRTERHSSGMRVYLYSDMTAEQLQGDYAGFVRVWDKQDILITTVRAQRYEGTNGCIAFADIPLPESTGQEVFLQAWFESQTTGIPASPIHKAAC